MPDQADLVIATEEDQFEIKPGAGLIHFHFPGDDTTFSMHAGSLKNILTHNMESSDSVSSGKID